MDIILREQLESILLNFSDSLADEEVFENALHEALDALERLFIAGPVSTDLLLDEYELIQDTAPSLPLEETMQRLAEAINERLRGEQL